MSRNLSETERKKNQFDKEERVHLLAIMKQYAPLLDTSTSTLARKRIWTIIEEEFKKEGFTRKTSAQLKKYWQNYKYHCKKAKVLGKVFTCFIMLVIFSSFSSCFLLFPFISKKSWNMKRVNTKLIVDKKNFSVLI